MILRPPEIEVRLPPLAGASRAAKRAVWALSAALEGREAVLRPWDGTWATAERLCRQIPGTTIEDDVITLLNGGTIRRGER